MEIIIKINPFTTNQLIYFKDNATEPSDYKSVEVPLDNLCTYLTSFQNHPSNIHIFGEENFISKFVKDINNLYSYDKNVNIYINK